MRSEDFRADPRRPFTGAEYMESLRDGRAVYINGEKIADVTEHPAMRNSVRSLARLYDALHDPAICASSTKGTSQGPIDPLASKFLPCVTLNLAWRIQSRTEPSLHSVTAATWPSASFSAM